MSRMLIVVVISSLCLTSGCQQDESARARGVAALEAGDNDRAIGIFSEILADNPRDFVALSLRSYAYAEKGDHDRALGDLDKAIELAPNESSLFVRRGSVHAQKGDFAAALTDFDEAIQLGGHSPELYAARGSARAEQGDTKGAIEDLNFALQRGADRAGLFASRASVLHKAGDCKGAKQDYQRALEMDPDNVMTTNGLAWLLSVCKDDDVRNGKEALKLAVDACELSKWKDAAIIDTLAAAYAETGQYDRAVKWQKKAMELELAPRFVDGARQRLKLYQEGKPYRE